MDTVRRTETEGAEKVIVAREAQVGTDTGTTTDSFADTGTVLDAACFESVAFTMKNSGGANGLSWQILGSIDGTNFVEVVASANVAFGALGTPYTVAPAPYRYYKAQVKAQSAGNQTTFSCSIIVK